jgi:hypothetical protein
MNKPCLFKHHLGFFAGVLLTTSFFAAAQAPLEPKNGEAIYAIGQDTIVSGAATYVTSGQLTQAHDAIEQIEQAKGVRPMMTHFYVGEYTGNVNGWTFENRLKLLNDYNTAQGRDYIALFSFRFATPADLDKLFDGTYDTAIKSIGSQAAAANKPMFFRPFYEFNQYGDSDKLWNDYAALHKERTKQQWLIAAWIKFRQLVLEGGNGGKVAFVWCMLAANATDFPAYYPGDAYVDWIGIDIFSSAHLSNAAGPILNWVKTKTNRGDGKPKPIILPEVQPGLTSAGQGGLGTQAKQVAVTEFFTPLFKFIEDNNEVKGLVYMNFWFNKLYTDDTTNYKWVKDAGLDGWGDGRVQPTAEANNDTKVFDFFSSKIGNNAIYLYEGEYLDLPSVVLTVNPPPSSASSSSAAASSKPASSSMASSSAASSLATSSAASSNSSSMASSADASSSATSSTKTTGGKKKGGGAVNTWQILMLLLLATGQVFNRNTKRNRM